MRKLIGVSIYSQSRCSGFFMARVDKNTCQLYNNDKDTCQERSLDLLKLVNKLSEVRKKKGINQTDLGNMVGVSRQTISLIERGDYNPSVMVALSLARVFDMRVEDIFGLEEEYE